MIHDRSLSSCVRAYLYACISVFSIFSGGWTIKKLAHRPVTREGSVPHTAPTFSNVKTDMYARFIYMIKSFVFSRINKLLIFQATQLNYLISFNYSKSNFLVLHTTKYVFTQHHQHSHSIISSIGVRVF